MDYVWICLSTYGVGQQLEHTTVDWVIVCNYSAVEDSSSRNGHEFDDK